MEAVLTKQQKENFLTALKSGEYKYTSLVCEKIFPDGSISNCAIGVLAISLGLPATYIGSSGSVDNYEGIREVLKLEDRKFKDFIEDIYERNDDEGRYPIAFVETLPTID